MSIKVAIIGGGGRVGASAAFALQCGGIVREFVLVDVAAQAAEGEALDLLHGSSLAGDQAISSGPVDAAVGADVVCITAGSRRKPDESRLDLINRNVALFRGVLDELKARGLKREAILLVVSNPVDILTRLAIERLGWPAQQVIGLGTVLDTARFCSLIAAAKGWAATQVRALILGEHGDSMVPIWSSAAYAGMGLSTLLSVAEQNQLFEKTKGSGAQVIRKKGGAAWAVGLSIAQVIHSIALDRRRVLPVSTQMNGQYGLWGVCLSLPTAVGRAGVIETKQVDLWPKEVTGLQASARAMAQTWAKVG